MTIEHLGINKLFDHDWELSEDGMSVIIDNRIEIVMTNESYENCTAEEYDFIMQAISLIPDMFKIIACTARKKEKTLPENVITVTDLTERYNVSRRSIYNWINDGKLPPPKIMHRAGRKGNMYYWDTEEIEKFEETRNEE